MKLNHRRTWRAVVAACATAGVLLAGASAAQATTYYDIVNKNTGQALELDGSGTNLRMATPDPASILQQFKVTETETHGANWFSASIRNRLGGCLVDNASGASQFQLGQLQVSSCLTSTKSKRMWSHLSGSQTATPSVPGYQFVNEQTARYAVPPLCLLTCDTHAVLWPALSLPDDEFGSWAKWEYRFAVTAP